MTVFIFVHLLDKSFHFHLADEKSSALEKILQLTLTNGTVFVDVAGVESLENVEARHLVQALAELLRDGLDFEMSAPQVLEFELSLTCEAIVTLVEPSSVVV